MDTTDVDAVTGGPFGVTGDRGDVTHLARQRPTRYLFAWTYAACIASIDCSAAVLSEYQQPYKYPQGLSQSDLGLIT